MSNKKKCKLRADILLVERGLCESREQARRLILEGKVRLGKDHLIRKPSDMLDESVSLFIDSVCPYVSRGAYKLLPAIDKYLPDLTGLIAFDIGASTGGFTDLMLQRNAEKVYTVDVGRGQMHSKLRNDPRVICHEKVNARLIGTDFLPEKADLITMDISFISVMLVLPSVNPLLKTGGWAFILIKPQFEAGKKDVGKGGIVRDENIRLKCVEKVANFAEKELDWEKIDVISSTVAGENANREFMAVFKKNRIDKPMIFD